MGTGEHGPAGVFVQSNVEVAHIIEHAVVTTLLPLVEEQHVLEML